MKVTRKHVFFWGGVFGNFHPCRIETAQGIFSSSEQMFMYMKAKHFNDDAIAEMILNATFPKEAKALGRKVSNFDEEIWSNVRFNYMKIAVRAKFTQNPELLYELLSDKYEGKSFVEASPFDKVWGIGMAEDNSDIHNQSLWGLNLLGKVLDGVREELLANK